MWRVVLPIRELLDCSHNLPDAGAVDLDAIVAATLEECRVIMPTVRGGPDRETKLAGLELRGELQNARLKELRRRWDSWPKPAGIPERGAFDPADMKRLLPYLVLAGIQDQANEFRAYDVVFRYVGGFVADLFDARGLTGSRLSSIGEAFANRWFPVVDAMLKLRRPLTFASPLQGTEKDFIHFELLVLPLTAQSGTQAGSVDFVLAGVSEIEPTPLWRSKSTSERQSET